MEETFREKSVKTNITRLVDINFHDGCFHNINIGDYIIADVIDFNGKRRRIKMEVVEKE